MLERFRCTFCFRACSVKVSLFCPTIYFLFNEKKSFITRVMFGVKAAPFFIMSVVRQNRALMPHGNGKEIRIFQRREKERERELVRSFLLAENAEMEIFHVASSPPFSFLRSTFDQIRISGNLHARY